MTIKFLTLNIWIGHFLDEVISFLKQENVDIVVLQEVYNGSDGSWDKAFRSYEILKKELGYPYFSIAPHVIDVRPFGKVEQGNVIFSKFPIKSEKVVFYNEKLEERSEETETDWSNWPCNVQHVELDINGKTVDVLNTHGPWGLDGGDNARRIKMSEVIVEQVKDKKYVILAGDFNVKPDTQTVKTIEEQLRNVFKGELVSTFNMKHKTNQGYATAVVDMVFVSKNISILNRICPDVNVSDHLPLVCTLQL